MLRETSTIVFVVSLVLPAFGTFAEMEKEGSTNFTHTVLAEYGTLTTCPYCPDASELLYRIYNSSDYPFYYISFVIDKSKEAKKRMRWYLDWFVPMVYFDGGYAYCLGSNESSYIDAIEECGKRTVHSILMNVTGQWENGEIKISIHIENKEKKIYVGLLKVYITEMVSRWKDYNGDPYHFAFLDFAIKRPVILLPGKAINLSVSWDPNVQVTSPDNIMIISSVSSILPHLKRNPWDRPKPNMFLAFYVDQVAAYAIE